MSIVFDFHDKVIVVHAVIGCLAVLGTLPAALLAQRYAKMKQIKSPYHSRLNLATGLLITITFALGTAAVASQGQGYQFTGPSMDLHHDMGLALFILVVLQISLGLIATRIKSPSITGQLRGKGVLRWLHIAFGGTIAVLLVVQAWNGFDEWNTMQSTGTITPDGVRYAFVVVAGIEVAVYLYLACRSVLLRFDERGPWAHLVEEKVSLALVE